MPRAFPLLVLLALTLIPSGCATARAVPDFTLQDDGGSPWRLSAQRNDAVLLTFGFTHCADTCPATLAKLTRATQSLGARSSHVEIAFVTVDPTRDTPAALHRFLARFAAPGASRIVGLTGTQQAISAVERDYHVYSQKKAAVRGNYDVIHSTAIVLIAPGGGLRGFADEEDSERALAASIRSLLG